MTLSNPAQYISGRTVQEQMNSLIDYVDQRAAEVATDAIAADVAQVHSDAADAHTDALAAAASAAAAAGTLTNAVKKTGEASQSIAGDIAVAGALSGGSVSSSGNVDGASIGSGTTPVVCDDLTAFGNVSLDDTTLQGNLAVADPSAVINLSGAGSVLVPTPTSNGEAATKKYVDDALDNYAPMVRNTGSMLVGGFKSFQAFTGKFKNIGITSSDTIELFRFSATANQDNRLLIAIGDYLTVKFGTLPIEPSGSNILLKSVVSSATVMGTTTFTVGASYASDGKVIVSASSSGNSGLWFMLMTAHTGSRFPINESSFDFTHYGEAAPTPIVTVTV